MSRLPLTLALLTLPLHAAQVTIPLTGTGASEANGNGHAFVIPDLDGLTVNPDGTVNYNPLTYPPPPFNPTLATPSNQLPAPGPNEVFDIGDLTYNDSLITRQGTEYIAPQSLGILLDLELYSDACGYELDVRPPTLPSQVIVVKNFTGPGLKLVNGTPVRLDFAAEITFQPTYKSPQTGQHSYLTSQPYRGRLVVENGTFRFDLADNSVNYYIGATNVHMEFDLIATIASLSEAEPPAPLVMPTLGIGVAGGNVTLTPVFPAATTRRFIFEASPSLAGGWQDLGSQFDSASAVPLVVPLAPPARFFRIRSIEP
ncbi:hypothetical protein OKA04_12560 [Luteolibacter flavescens]|uniref:PEP-CTERM sorting domain-containing protein n=1 Tax=Luteolibacter flavescens TaxID=1859460 RepID=A0ABT3FPR1_9BACT|nr:hypothetical protein [Luteolibacter flavescens]MCW1885563.1 hypothetical protein [Luteolibacter flavescens]